jgi:prophage maintenance system killer protein
LSELIGRDLLFLHGEVARYLGRPRGVAHLEALRRVLRAPGSVSSGDLFEQAAALAQAIVHARPFLAANIALGAAAAVFFLRPYGLALELPLGEMGALRPLLTGANRAALADWLRSHTGPLPPDDPDRQPRPDDRLVDWRKGLCQTAE